MAKNDWLDAKYVTFVLNRENKLCQELMESMADLMMAGELVYASHGNVSDELKELQDKIKYLEVIKAHS